MSQAFEQAQRAAKEGNFPVGAVLTIDGRVVDKARNLIATNLDWISHAEMNLLNKYSSLIKKSRKAGSSVVIYSTFEPCLMCLGACALHRISKIVYSCPDNFTGATSLDRKVLPAGYNGIFPQIESVESFRTESRNLVLKYMNERKSAKWDEARGLMQNIE